jgi:hypothetical protein
MGKNTAARVQNLEEVSRSWSGETGERKGKGEEIEGETTLYML